MTPETTHTVREIALEMPCATRVFEKLGIDYCCGGQRTMEEACAAAGIDLTDVTRALKEAAQQQAASGEITDFTLMTLTELIGYILEKHHVFTKEELSRLDSLVAKVCSAHGQRHAELLRVQQLFGDLKNDLQPHMFKEEMVLFPYIVRMEEAARRQGQVMPPPFGTVRNPVRMMSFEHDHAGDILRELREVSGNYTVPQDGCISYRTLYEALENFERDLHEHIHLENNLLFPRAVELENSLQSATV